MDGRAREEGGLIVSKAPPPRPAPRLYLATPVIADPAPLAAKLPEILGSADVAAVLVRLKETDPRSMISVVKALVPPIQGAGAALLIDGHAELVARSGADGAHLNGIAALDEALPTLKPDRIAGVGALTTRHDSMSAGERGADYVLFGEPDAQGGRPAADAIAERLGWWAELFEPPCIGYAATREEAIDFVAAGADFILADDLVWQDARGPAAALADLGAAIKAAYTAPNTAAAGQE
jgi:thiamine-phosphate pyrophosphorylase